VVNELGSRHVASARSVLRGEGFAAASGMARMRVAMRHREYAAAFGVVRRPADACSALAFIRSLPVVAANTTDSPAGRWVQERIAPDSWIRKLGIARAVLEIPRSTDDYLRGRRKQAMRTNLRHAAKLGSTVRVASLKEAADLDTERRRRGQRTIAGRPGQALLLICSPDGTLRGFSVVTVDREWAHLDSFVGLGPRHEFLAARYLLQLHVVDYVRGRDVRFLHAGSALAVNSSVQYFQYLVGYDPVNVRTGKARARSSSRANGRPA
jgi:hypothetical protein